VPGGADAPPNTAARTAGSSAARNDGSRSSSSQMLGTTSSQVTPCSRETSTSDAALKLAIVTAEPPDRMAGASCVTCPDTQANDRWIAVRSRGVSPSSRT
jgi:hypothetical protein